MIGVAAMLLAAMVAPWAAAAESCPWINAATVEGVLGVPVKSAVTHVPGTGGKHARIQCAFAAPDGNLYIEVEFDSTSENPFEAAAAKCSTNPVLVRALATQAFACPTEPHGGSLTEKIFGRVRDQLFTVELTDRAKPSSPGKVRSEVRAIADHVAGNLF